MIRFPLFTLILTFLLCLLPQSVQAIVDPLLVPNNHFGIHINDQNDIDQAAQLVNSNQGDWGYVTVVIREDDRDLTKWQNTLDHLRRQHLIPIIRIATKSESQLWTKPRLEDLDPWVSFLNSLNWVTSNRYIVLFNEPNHAKEWGGEIEPEEFASISLAYHQALKSASSDFFILPAALDLSAANTSSSMDPRNFYQRIYNSHPEYFTTFDGWTNHSYPNPAFSATTAGTGRNSIRGFIWEQSFLAQFGLPYNLPIFITETGWSSANLPASTVASRTSFAFESIFNHPQVVAVTPFLLKYQQTPFDTFSWLDPVSQSPRPVYQAIQNLPKPSGSPQQYNNSILPHRWMPTTALTNSQLEFAVTFVNSGQLIWEPSTTVPKLTLSSNPPSQATASAQLIEPTEPFQPATFWITLTTPDSPVDLNLSIQLTQDSQPFGETLSGNIQVAAQTNLAARIRLLLDKIFHYRDLVIKSLASILARSAFS